MGGPEDMNPSATVDLRVRSRYDSMLNPLLAGTAVASTDDGHSGGGSVWALGHPEKIIDYGYRAVHLTAEIAKAVTTAFYETKPHHSYFVGCSKGGQEALMEAQRYPGDFDGILGAANANQWTALFSSFAWNQKLNQADKALTFHQPNWKRSAPPRLRPAMRPMA